MNGEHFSLDALIEQVGSEVGPDPLDIARKVQDLIPEECRADVELRLLMNYIRSRKVRLTQAINFSERGRRGLATEVSGGRKPNRSAKVAGFQRLARVLAIQVCVGPSKYKVLGDCSFSDLTYAANNRRQHAAATLSAAAEFEAWAELLQNENVSTVSQISHPTLIAFIESRKATVPS